MNNMKKLLSLFIVGLLFGTSAMAGNFVTNGDFSGDDYSAFYKSINGALDMVNTDDIYTDSGNPCLKVVSLDNATNSWDTQLFINLPVELPEGTTYKFTIRAKASKAATINSWFQPELGRYKTPKGVGELEVNTSWKTFVCTGVIDSEMAGAKTICLLLNVNTTSVTYYFDDITFQASVTPEAVELVTNGSFTGTDISTFKKDVGNGIVPLTNNDVVTESGNSFVKIVSIDNNDNPTENWRSMFFVQLSDEVQVGDSYTFTMKARANREVRVSGQFQHNPGEYVYYNAVGEMNLSTEWQTFTYTGNYNVDMVSSNFGNAQAIGFLLNIDPNSAEYYFDDISFMVTRHTETNLSPNEINGLRYSFNDDTSEATVIGCSLTGDVTVPATVVRIEFGTSYFYRTYSVTSIGDAAFSGCNGVTSVTLPSTIKSIGCQAFINCMNLENINLPTGLETIGEEAFYFTNLHHLSLPTGLKTIGPNAYALNFNLYDLYIPSSLESIGEKAFDLCPALQTIIYRGQTPIAIPDNAFFAATIAEIALFLPDGGKSAFEVAPTWNRMKISDERVGYHKASGLRFLHFFDDHHMEVLRSTYSGDITIPRTVFIKGKNIPGEQNNDLICPVTAIRDNAFSSCEGITSVTFSGNSSAPSNLTSIGNAAFYGCTGITSVTLPSTLTNIGDMAFVRTGISSVTIPAGVTSIGEHPFSTCQNLTSITVNSNNTVYDSRNNCKAIIETATNTLIQGCLNTTIPNEVTNIAYAAFSGFSNLTSITIPENVTTIGQYAFESCGDLTTVYCYAMTPPEIYDDTTFPSRFDATLYVPYGTKRAYQTAEYWKDFKYIETMAVPDVTLTIGSTGVGTFASSYDLDFTNVTGMKAYIASGFNPANGKLVLTQVDEVPAGTGLYVKGTKGTYNIPVKETSMYLHNMLVGVTERTYLEATTGDNTNFTLQNGPSGVGFYTVSPGYLAAGKAYLTLPTRVLSAQASPIMVEFEDEETTGIVSVESLTPNAENGAWYTLDGRKLESKPTQKGVYIVNGKKTVIK